MFEILFEPAKKFITIVGSIVGGVVALFAASGFLAETMLASVLGISEINPSYEQYVMTGAKFFLSVVGYLLLSYYFWSGVIILFVAIRLIGWLINSQIQNIKRPRFYRYLFSLLQIGFLFATIYYLFDFLKILNYRERDILYLNKIPDIYLNSLCQNNIHPGAVSNYQRLIFLAVIFILGIIIMEFLKRSLLQYMPAKDKQSDKSEAGGNTTTGKKKRLFEWHQVGFYTPYLIWLVVFFELLLLPFNFSGVLIVERHYPIVNVVSDNTEINWQLPGSYNFTLVASNDRDIFLYDPAERKSRVIAKNFLKEIKIVSKNNIFQIVATDTRCK